MIDIEDSSSAKKRSLDLDSPVSSGQQKHRKSLSIDTRLTEKIENTPALLEKMKSNFKVKQQQQAIVYVHNQIESRNKSAGIRPMPGPPSARIIKQQVKNLNWTGPASAHPTTDLNSPRSEFPTRELPLPKGYEQTHSQSAHPVLSTAPKPSRPPQGSPTQLQSAGAGPVLSRTAFMNVFETMYDQHDSGFRIQNQLKDQLRKTSALLQTLQSSGQMIEGLVRGHFRDMQGQYADKFGASLKDLNRRLDMVEAKLGIAPKLTVTSHLESAGSLKRNTPKSAPLRSQTSLTQEANETLEKRTIEALLGRLEALESKALNEEN